SPRRTASSKSTGEGRFQFAFFTRMEPIWFRGSGIAALRSARAGGSSTRCVESAIGAPLLAAGAVGNQYGNGPIGTGALPTFDNEKEPISGRGLQRSGAVIPDRCARSATIGRGSPPRARRAESGRGRSP